MSFESGFGFGVPFATALNPDGGVDFDGTRRFWDHLFKNDVDVGVVLGTTGRGRKILAASMDDAKKLVDIGIELGAKHRKKVVVGTGAEKLEDAVELTAYAASLKVDAVLVTDPIHAISEFAQARGTDPLSYEYQSRLVDDYHKKIMDAIPVGSDTLYMPYIFPVLTAGNDLGYPKPRILNRLWEYAERTGKKMGGGKLTHEDKSVARSYRRNCPQLFFQAGFDHKALAFVADPTLNFNGAIYGVGNLTPKFLGSHVRDCLALREMRIQNPDDDGTFALQLKATDQQHQVNGMFSYLWETPGAFPRVIHGVLGLGTPPDAPKVPQERLEVLADAIAATSPSLAKEMTGYNPNTPLARRMLAGIGTPKKRVKA